MPAVAITDTGNLFGALEFSQACTGKGVQPIIGCQVGLVRTEKPGLPPDPVVLLAQTREGLANLQRLSSLGFTQSDPADPQLPLRTVLDHAAGLILLTGGTRGPLARLLAEGRQPEAAAMLAEIAEAFGDRAVVELHRHGLPVERAIEPGLIALADAAGLPLVATNECFFATPTMQEAHDALLCIAGGRMMADPERRRVTGEHWFKPAAAMRALFADLPEACDNTLAIARRCAVMAETRKPLLPVCPKVRPAPRRTRRCGPWRARGWPGAWMPLARMRRRGALWRAAGIRAGRHRRDGLPRLLPDRRRLHPVGEGAGHPGRAGPRLGRRVGGGLGADHHRPGPAAVRPAVRAVPEPRAHLDAGFRHRFLPGPARRGDRVRAPRIRRGPGGADHHLRQAAGARRGARRGPRAGPAVRPGEPRRRTDPEQPGQAGDAEAGDRRRAEAAADARRTTRPCAG